MLVPFLSLLPQHHPMASGVMDRISSLVQALDYPGDCFVTICDEGNVDLDIIPNDL